jgi:hypothetical protein
MMHFKLLQILQVLLHLIRQKNVQERAVTVAVTVTSSYQRQYVTLLQQQNKMVTCCSVGPKLKSATILSPFTVHFIDEACRESSLV